MKLSQAIAVPAIVVPSLIYMYSDAEHEPVSDALAAAPPLKAPATPLQAPANMVFQHILNFGAWTFETLAESEDGNPIDCTPTGITECANSDDCDYYGDTETEIIIVIEDGEYLATDIDDSRVAHFAVPTNQYVYLDWSSWNTHNVWCNFAQTSPCDQLDCGDVDICFGVAFWNGKVRVQYYCYDESGREICTESAPKKLVEFYHSSTDEWLKRVPRHGPTTTETFHPGMARVLGGGTNLSRVRVFFDYAEGYYVAGAKNMYMDENDSVDCDVSVVITQPAVYWRLYVPE